jgi:hypothetical protein
MRTDGRTEMTKLTVIYRNFANAPNELVITDKYNDREWKVVIKDRNV